MGSGDVLMEAVDMEFSTICPNDGPIEVGLDCISTITFRGFESMTVVFVCPQCGAEIEMRMQIPDLLVAAVEFDAASDGPMTFDAADDMPLTVGEDRTLASGDQQRLERYCEYFRRQLASVDDVDEVLAEIDSRLRP
jgi:hypothetical protein